MDKMNIDVNVKADGPNNVVQIGKEVIVLKDYSTFTYKTDDIESFVEYCKNIEPMETGKNVIYFASNVVEIINQNLSSEWRNSEPIAECMVKITPFVSMLRRIEDTPLALPEFEEFLFMMRPFIDDTGRALYSYVRNFRASKLTSVKREVDNKGNYNYQVIREKGGTTDVEIPEQLVFQIPVVTNNIFKSFSFDVYFTWKDTEDGCNVTFKLKNPLLTLMIDDAIKESLLEAMSKLPFPKFWGSLDKKIKDDKWMYLFNGLEE